MTFRAVWEQPSANATAVFTSPSTGQPATITRGSFGPGLPHAVQTIRIVLEFDAGPSCCVAVNPTNVPIDPVSGGAFLVLDALPAGPAMVSLAGFAADFAPAPQGVSAVCATDPAASGQSCDATRPATPSYLSDPKTVTINANAETDAGDIPVYAVPFLLDMSPVPGSSTVSPVPFSYTIVDALSGVDPGSVTLSVTQGTQPAMTVPLTVSACDDSTNNPCSPCGQFGVKGVLATSTAETIGSGPAAAHLGARNLASVPRSLDFTYDFQVSSQFSRADVSTVLVFPPASIAEAAKQAAAGSTIIVAPGVYAPVALAQGDLPGSMTFLADTTGTLTSSPPAAVVINGRNQSPAIALSDQSNITIDGFTLRAATEAALVVTRGSGIVVRNSIISGGSGDGVRFEGSSKGLVFDNLIYNNSGTGIRARATTSLGVINNTLYNNASTGLLATDSCNLVVKNNIVNHNRPAGIVETSTGGYSADFNLNTDGYGGTTPVGAHDINRDPLFIAPGNGDFHLPRGLAGSTSPAVDKGDRATDPTLASMLESRTTQTDGSLDTPPVDLGFHYPGP